MQQSRKTSCKASDLKTPRTHLCKHCQIPLQAPSEPPQFPFRIPYLQTVDEARAAAEDGCTIFEELLQHYADRNRWRLIKSHIRPCHCCSGGLQRLKYVFKSLGSRPFQLLFLPERHRREAGSTTFNSFVYFDCGNGPAGSHSNAYTYRGDDAASLVPSFDLEVDTPRTIDSVNEWLRSCKCFKPPVEKDFKPTRLLDLGKDDTSQHVRVIETYNIDVATYVCLSYCWGGYQPIVCTAESMGSSGIWKIPVQNLPKTFLDATRVTRQLQFRYLWIDSLCIKQDDRADIATEISRMPQIYQNCELTICASSARACSNGFLQPRPDYSESRVQIRMPQGRRGTVYLDRIPWAFPPVKEPLGTRAWALQERILSPRILEYGWRTARWACSCTGQYSGFTPFLVNASDLESELLSRPHFNLYNFLNPLGLRKIATTRNELFACWAGIVQRYSALDLTFPVDRLAAISGVAAELQRRTGVEYLAGLWKYDRLPSLLQWKVTSSPADLLDRPTDTRAPSWSWASIDNAVTIQHSPVVIESFQVTAAEAPNGFASSCHGCMTIRGPVRTGSWWCEDWMFEQKISPEWSFFTRPDIDLTIWPDCLGEIVRFEQGMSYIVPRDLTFVGIGRAYWDRKTIRGLVLSEINVDEYRRVGFFEMADSDAFPVDRWDVKTMRIS